MKYYILPADFKKETIDGYIRLNSLFQTSKVIETYGNIILDNQFGSGRSSDDLPKINFEKLKEYVDYSIKNKIKFNYTMNASSIKNEELTKSGIKKIKEFLKKIFDIGIHSVTVSLPSLIEIIKAVDKDCEVKASVICSINTAQKALGYKKLGVDKIVVDESINRDFEILKNIIKSFGDGVEIIANAICYNNCIYRQFHYNSYIFDSIVYQSDYKYYIKRCVQRMINDPSIFIKSSWIRPEDIKYYNGIGINFFKLQGRDLILSANPCKTLEVYFNESFDGDLWELNKMFDSNYVPAVKIDNKKLEGFLEPFFKNKNFCKHMCSECNYCSSFVEKSMSIENLDIVKDYVNSDDYDKFGKDIKM